MLNLLNQVPDMTKREDVFVKTNNYRAVVGNESRLRSQMRAISWLPLIA